MALAVISDIHANIEALEVVLKKIDELNPEGIVCLGDIIGYGPDPNECCELIKEKCDLVLMGNHDAFVSDFYPDVSFAGRRAWPVIVETTKNLAKENTEFLKTLLPKKKSKDVLYAHGNPAYMKPYCIVEYVLPDMALREPQRKIPDTDPAETIFEQRYHLGEIFDYMLSKKRKYSFVGHTHLAFAAKRAKFKGYSDSKENLEKIKLYMARHNLPDNETSFELELDPESQYIFNPGSVGQPRDWDNRASFMTLHKDKAVWHRCEYDIEKTVKKLKKFNIPEKYWQRLSQGE